MIRVLLTNHLCLRSEHSPGDCNPGTTPSNCTVRGEGVIVVGCLYCHVNHPIFSPGPYLQTHRKVNIYHDQSIVSVDFAKDIVWDLSSWGCEYILGCFVLWSINSFQSFNAKLNFKQFSLV